MKLILRFSIILCMPWAWSSDIFDAIDEGDEGKVAEFIKSGTDLDKKHKGWTPMTYAAVNGNTNMVVMFLDNGAYINQKGRKGWTALIAASRYGYTDMAKMLLERGAEVNHKVKMSNATALLTAISFKHEAIALMILDYDVEVNTLNNTGWTPLMAAARRGMYDTVVKLLEKRAKPNMGARSDGRGNYKGNTPLLLASAKGYLDVVKVLVENGADIYLHPGGQSPYKTAKKRKHKEVAEYLKSVHEEKFGKKNYSMLN